MERCIINLGARSLVPGLLSPFSAHTQIRLQLALNRCKLSFRLDGDGNPHSVQEYPIRDSNRTVEEYMLLVSALKTD